jgi:hypothetical protein
MNLAGAADTGRLPLPAGEREPTEPAALLFVNLSS